MREVMCRGRPRRESMALAPHVSRDSLNLCCSRSGATQSTGLACATFPIHFSVCFRSACTTRPDDRAIDLESRTSGWKRAARERRTTLADGAARLFESAPLNTGTRKKEAHERVRAGTLRRRACSLSATRATETVCEERVSPASPVNQSSLPKAFVRTGTDSGSKLEKARVIVNDPSAGSPTETLLRLLLPLNDQVRASSRNLRRRGEPLRRGRSQDLTKPFNR